MCVKIHFSNEMSSLELDVPSEEVVLLQRYFLSVTPLQMFDIKEILGMNCSMTEQVQKNVLEATVLHPATKKFPPKPSYQKAFLKAFMAQVEDSGAEICDELYSALCTTLVGQGMCEDYHYRHYLLTDDVSCTTSVVLRESCSIISGGTTGLCTWQASQALAEWCLSHRAILANRCVLELGSGAGLTGLVVSLHCEPASYIFSDCHPVVLELLQENVARNVAVASVVKDVATTPEPGIAVCDKLLYKTTFRHTTIEVINLPWELVPFKSSIVPEVILAADVVYDCTIFEPLCEALRHLTVEVNTECLIVLACTVRNSHTLGQFFSKLASSGLRVQSEEAVKPTIFIYSSDPPVKIYTISSVPSADR